MIFAHGIFLFSFLDIFETLAELDFVVRVLVFSYILFWLYMTFMTARADILFGVTAILAGYLVFAHGVTITILALFFLFFVVLGSQLQMIIQFGVLPLMGYQYGGDRFVKVEAGGGAENAEALANGYYQGQEEEAGQSQAALQQMQLARLRRPR
ncbi:TPA: hypothetical protein HA244_03805 [Candidatus Micrarchaeota archaeon]|nr:hypothetical protein [Candidatus Micrarchaeota archaeon]